MNNQMLKTALVWATIVVGLLLVVSYFGRQTPGAQRLTYSRFLTEVHEGRVARVEFRGPRIEGALTSGSHFRTYAPVPDDPSLVRRLVRDHVTVLAKPPSHDRFMSGLIEDVIFGALFLFGMWWFLLRPMQGGGGGRGAFSFGRSRARMLTEDQVRVTFNDVAGADEAKEEVVELVEFLRDPGKFQRLGGRIPRGVLLVGPPGTGKTLLAKAIAGEAKVPFFSISGSDFVEMFVGVGASRVRDMFEQAKKHAPCIIFIDEIDAVGRHRGAGLGGGHDEREQTLNQLLVEMDGFAGNEGIIVIAATNRPDVLDPALLRPGRFDRQVVVPLPDVRGREQILRVHMRRLPLGNDVRPDLIARGTPGFSGADLMNLVNEAALFAARGNKRTVDMTDFERAKDKILMGSERRSMVMNDQEKKLTAYHEAGHAIVGLHVPDHDPVYKVSIIPRGRALGVTMFLPEADRYSYSKRRLESQICSLFGGRIAEELVFGPEQVTTGASNDIERATEIARNMVTRWGLSQRLGPLAYSEEEGEIFLGRTVSRHKQVSDETTHVIDEEVRGIVETNYKRAKQILLEQRQKLDLMAEALIRYETIDSEQIEDILAGKPPRPPAGWNETTPEPPPGGTAAAPATPRGDGSSNDGVVVGPAGQH